MDHKKRSTNFTSKEESLLVSLADKYKQIIESKLSDTTSNNRKRECWFSIEKQFNSQSGDTYRSEKVLRKKYDNIKKRTKKKYADEKCYVKGTGGGPFKKIELDDIDVRIKEILGTRVEGQSSEFDTDAIEDMNLEETSIHLEEQDNETTVENFTEKQQVECLTSDSIGILQDLSNADIIFEESNDVDTNQTDKLQNGNWKKYNSKMLKSKPAVPLIFSKKLKQNKKQHDTVKSKVSQWAEKKTLVEEANLQYINEEWQLKLKFATEKHQLEMQILKENADLELNIRKEQHQARMKILEIEKQILIKRNSLL